MPSPGLGRGVRRVRKQVAIVIIGIHVGPNLQVSDVVSRLDAPGLHFSLTKHRHQYGGEDSDDGDDHQEFNQSKPAAIREERGGSLISLVEPMAETWRWASGAATAGIDIL